ncbi:unnamed protein product [Protopolystoma xenopodis]|uniref:Uncharacterized protein n=1 Tax=Protopolystoma xenopodis TaxID=117903 RepID=A0A3S5B314_9PLAT|nr:unnamed protein product [Protopolystoma xenopodis]
MEQPVLCSRFGCFRTGSVLFWRPVAELLGRSAVAKYSQSAAQTTAGPTTGGSASSEASCTPKRHNSSSRNRPPTRWSSRLRHVARGQLESA